MLIIRNSVLAWVLLSTGFVPSIALNAASSCAKELALVGLCTSNTGSEIIIDGSQHTEGDPGHGAPGDDWTRNNGWEQPHDESWAPPAEEEEEMEYVKCPAAWDVSRMCYLPRDDDAEPEEKMESLDVVLPTVTITDVARFAPAGSTVRGEPDNLGVAGLPTNFITSATTHTESGALFGHPVWVRFTPVGYDFDYGDGHTLTTTSAGASWTTLDQAPFTPTDTSHTYQERGTYTTRVTVRYAAEIEFGTGWTPITGEVRSPGPTQDVRILEARTALVAHTCTTTPTSPGC